MKNKRHRKGLHVLFMLFALAAISAIIMLLWNWLIPSIIGWSAIKLLASPRALHLEQIILRGIRSPRIRSSRLRLPARGT